MVTKLIPISNTLFRHYVVSSS